VQNVILLSTSKVTNRISDKTDRGSYSKR